MAKIIPVLMVIAGMTAVIACNKGYGHGWGWGEPVIVLPKPTLIPKLKAAFIDGKLSVNYHKIVGPSLKPLPYKKGVGWLHKGHGWGHGWGHELNGIGIHDHFGGHIGYGKGFGYGKGVGFGKEIGIGWGKEVGLVGPVGPVGFKGPIDHGYIPPLGHHLPPVAPVPAKLPVHDVPLGHVGHSHTVSHNAVTVVEKGLPHVGIPHGPIGNELYGKK